jgi:chaperonin GroEL (HSP60 family)
MNKEAIIKGSLLGLVGVLFSMPVYLGSTQTILLTVLSIVKFIVIIGIAAFFVKGFSHKQGEIVAFKTVFIYSLVLLTAGTLLEQGFAIVYYNLFPENLEILAESTVESTYNIMKNLGMPEDQLKETLLEVEKGVLDAKTFKGFAKGFGGSSVINVILGLILGAIFKRNPQEEV